MTDKVANDEYFGRAGVNKGERSAFLQARVVGVVECTTHAVVDAGIRMYTTGENALAQPLVERLAPGMLVLADWGSEGSRCGNGDLSLKRSEGPGKPGPLCVLLARGGPDQYRISR